MVERVLGDATGGSSLGPTCFSGGREATGQGASAPVDANLNLADVVGLPGTRECGGCWDEGRDRRERAEPRESSASEPRRSWTARRSQQVTGPPGGCRPRAPGAVRTGRLAPPGQSSTLLQVPWVTMTLWVLPVGCSGGRWEGGEKGDVERRQGGGRRDRERPRASP